MSKKNRATVPPAVDRTQSGKSWSTRDSFQNFEARVGIGTDNQSSSSAYGFNFLTRNRMQLEAMYRGSWIVGKGVDVVAEDMTRAGIRIKGEIKPEQMDRLATCQMRLRLWDALCDTVKWGRLYGGAVGVILIDGQDMKTPLRPETVARGAFKGILPMDRWLLQPSLQDLVQEFGPSFGLPKYYDVVADSFALNRQRIHHSRVVRIDGVDLPFWQRQSENLWGMSIVERLFDRLVAFDSTTQGVGQLVYKAHLRTLAVDGFREVVAAGGPAMKGLTAQIDNMRRFQSNEGMTVIDAKDTFEAHQYTFSGLDTVLLQFGQQLSGALDIPLVRLFGQSPAGLNATGEADMKMYEDKINQDQERRLRGPLTVLLEVMCYSELGIAPPSGFGFEFAALSDMTATEKADVAQKTTQTVTEVLDVGLISPQTALRELRQMSEQTGLFTNITDKDIAEADDELPQIGEVEMPNAFKPDAAQAEVEAVEESGQKPPGGKPVRDPAQAGGTADRTSDFGLQARRLLRGSNDRGDAPRLQ